jgi:hypothetical protein
MQENEYKNIDNYKINIKPIKDNNFELIAKIFDKTYRAIINEKYYYSRQCPEIARKYNCLLKMQLENQIKSENPYSQYIRLYYSVDIIELNFNLNFCRIHEYAIFELHNFEETIDDPIINNKIKALENRVSELEHKIDELSK